VRVNTETGQLIAIKMISLALLGNETAMARFAARANILKQLKHPNIVRLLATGRYKKTPFLRDGVRRRRVAGQDSGPPRPFPWRRSSPMGRQLLRALQHAHQKGIIHRDLEAVEPDDPQAARSSSPTSASPRTPM